MKNRLSSIGCAIRVMPGRYFVIPAMYPLMAGTDIEHSGAGTRA